MITRDPESLCETTFSDTLTYQVVALGVVEAVIAVVGSITASDVVHVSVAGSVAVVLLIAIVVVVAPEDVAVVTSTIGFFLLLLLL